jgi:hypothetical protein
MTTLRIKQIGSLKIGWAIERLPATMANAIDAWAADMGVSRSEAIRQLVEAGLNQRGSQMNDKAGTGPSGQNRRGRRRTT